MSPGSCQGPVTLIRFDFDRRENPEHTTSPSTHSASTSGTINPATRAAFLVYNRSVNGKERRVALDQLADYVMVLVGKPKNVAKAGVRLGPRPYSRRIGET